ncbi:hypothetical protein EJ05DRAFT_38745 [Pseudovirgaria hyperparasitica]|uniref:Transcription factor domain-containing protein n=1 Tax=Pseudovirgaria hyperparasitica TaxID=470096 RepID=A0A6A6WMJ5_9PEZI|nr:uncharacterized protein EJ05DRAFT_38745 [Pseudovirgaria hyperparasitica]KAF2763440.1 hypothetical protein EJ05DRAFT_38745 [Pseudovirgaria hyperparasitica]
MREPYFVGGPLLWPSSHAEQGSPEALEVLEDHQLFTTDIKTMLFDLFTATELLYMEYHRVSEESTRATLSSLRGAIRLPPEPCTSVGIMERRASVMARIARACWLAGSVYLRAVVHEIPLTDPANAEPITELHKLLKNLDIQAWATMPYIHLWISLVGVGAAVNATQKRFYAVQTGRCGILFGSRWWDNYRQVVLNFVWLQKLLRGEIEKGGDAAPSLGSPEQHPDGGQGVDDMESSTYLLTPPDSSGDIRDTDELDFCDNPKT